MKKIFLYIALIVSTAFNLSAQGYYNLNYLSSPGNPGGINTNPDYIVTSNIYPPSGSTTIIGATLTPRYSASQTIPFAFNFNGGPVTQFTASSSGYITFSTVTLVTAGNTPHTLPSALLPDSSVCVWGLCTAGGPSPRAGQVYTKLYGTAPHRQLWIGWFAATNPIDTSSINFWAIVLEETTNNIYIVDQAHAYWTNISVYTAPNLTLGIQISPTVAYQVAGSPSIESIAAAQPNSDNDYYEFIPGTQPSYYASVIKSNIVGNGFYYGVGRPYNVIGNVENLGSASITSFKLNWSVDGGLPNTCTVHSLISSPNPITFDTAYSTIQWTPNTVGLHSMKIWVDTLNVTNKNQIPNDTLYINNINVVDTLATRQALYEQFTGQSCYYCMLANPNVDSVASKNAANSNNINYHVPLEGRDFIYNATQTLVNARTNYYSNTYAPVGFLDGTYFYPGTDETPDDSVRYSSTTIEADNSTGSPISIDISSVNYDVSTNKFSLSANITAYTALSAGLTAQVALCVDSLTFAYDLSMDDPQEEFQPPIGSDNPLYACPSCSDYYYPYLLKYQNVVEDMLPSASGTSLAAFTAGQTHTINVSWIKNHPWADKDHGAQADSDKYDSSSTVHFVVFVQTNSAIGNIPAQYVFQSASSPEITVPAGVPQVMNNTYFQMYPNPANNNTNLTFKLDKEQTTHITIYNIMGQTVYSVNKGIMPAGQHTILLDVSTLPAGIYFVNLNTDNTSSNEKLLIQR